jgi:hypothetical protein
MKGAGRVWLWTFDDNGNPRFPHPSGNPENSGYAAIVTNGFSMA